MIVLKGEELGEELDNGKWEKRAVGVGWIMIALRERRLDNGKIEGEKMRVIGG